MSKTHDERKAVQFAAHGNSTFLEDVALPFSQDVSAQLRESGFEDSLDGFQVPADLFPPRRGPTNVFGVETLLLGVTIYLGGKIGGWAVGGICDEIFNAKIKPALGRLTKVFQGTEQRWSPESGRPLRVQFGVWYNPDQLYVDVVAEVESLDEFENLARLIPQAHEAALSWIQVHGAQERVLTLRMRGGKPIGDPSWSSTAVDHSLPQS